LSIARIAQLENWVLQSFTPDMTLLLDVPVEIGMRRVESRGEKDRIERESLDFFNRVRDAYIARSKQYPERIKLIDASQSATNTSNQIQEILKTL
jgi:dTMP kinase